jgi:hypothetical protein
VLIMDVDAAPDAGTRGSRCGTRDSRCGTRGSETGLSVRSGALEPGFHVVLGCSGMPAWRCWRCRCYPGSAWGFLAPAHTCATGVVRAAPVCHRCRLPTRPATASRPCHGMPVISLHVLTSDRDISGLDHDHGQFQAIFDHFWPRSWNSDHGTAWCEGAALSSWRAYNRVT